MAKLIVDGREFEIDDTTLFIRGNKGFVGLKEEIELEFESDSVKFNVDETKIEITSVE